MTDFCCNGFTPLQRVREEGISLKLRRYFKDIVLTLLVVITFVQVFQIWFSDSIVPNTTDDKSSRFQDYILSPFLQLFGKERTDTFPQYINELLRPQKIVLNQSNQRAVLYSDDESYGRFYDKAEELMRGLFTGATAVKSRETVSMDDYCAVLKGNSIYFDYSNLYDYRLFSVSICGESKNELSNDFSVVRECMISLDDNVLNNVVFYMKDYKSGNMIRYVVDQNKKEFQDELKNYFLTKQSDSTLNYSFELNFHKQENNDGALSKLIFDPLILFNLVAADCRAIIPEQPLRQNWTELEAGRTNAILKAFQINPMTMRKYTNLTNAKVFVENNATLNISPGGYLQYQTVKGWQGLPISKSEEKSGSDIYTAVSAAVNFVYSLNEELLGDSLSSLRFSSDLIENGTPGNYTITFDTCAAGLPVLQVNPETGEKEHYITMVIENGYLKYYSQSLKQYHAANGSEPLTPVISAVDGLVDQLNGQQLQTLNILNVSRCYVDGGKEDNPEPYWNIGVDGISSILTVR